MAAEGLLGPPPDGMAYHELAEIVRQRGWLKRSPSRVVSELAFHTLIHLGGVALFIFVPNLLVRAVAVLLMGYGALGMTTNTHTSSHYATSNSLALNRFLTYLGCTFFFGLSASYWWNKHCVIHHPAPNIIEVDADADLMPFFAINQREVAQSRGILRFFYRVQWIIMPVVVAFNAFFSQVQGYRFLFSALRDRKRRRPGHWLDLALIVTNYVVWIGIPMFFFPPLNVIGFYILRYMVMSYVMFIGFAPAHYPAEALFVDKSRLGEDWVLRQTATTLNFRTGFFGRLACSGVEYQIEHHLFPSVPHFYYPEMSKVVEEYCRRNGYPYRTIGWVEGVWKSFVTFKRQKPVVDDIAPLRSRSASATS